MTTKIYTEIKISSKYFEIYVKFRHGNNLL